MQHKRKIDIFIAGCPICDHVVEIVRRIACDSCEVSVLDLAEERVAEQAARLGVRSVPAVAVDGELARCCAGQGVDEEVLINAGVGRPL